MIQRPHFLPVDRLERLRARRTDPIESPVRAKEIYERMQEESSAIRYAIGAMQPIDPTYTKNTYAEGDRILNQLDKNLVPSGIVCEFEYQGSVTNDTHIKARSDIDLLTLHCAFYSLDPPQKPTAPYEGNPLADLLLLRQASHQVLKEKFPEATVDASGSKSISIEGGSLRRKIDVVASNWCNTCDFARTGLKRDRAIEILDIAKRERIKNLPFLHNDRIHNKDEQTVGGFRKAVRLLKSLKYDSDDGVNLSSYDIAAIVYAMDSSQLTVYRGMELLLVQRCKQHLDYIADHQLYRESLVVPNGTRRIFCEEGATLKGLNQLRREVDQLLYDIEHDLARSFRKLAAARVEYA